MSTEKEKGIGKRSASTQPLKPILGGRSHAKGGENPGSTVLELDTNKVTPAPVPLWKPHQVSYSALHLIKPCLKKPLWVIQSKSVGTDFSISLRVQNIPVYKATPPVLAFVYTIHQSATFTHKSCKFS